MKIQPHETDANILASKAIPDFSVGDTVVVNTYIPNTSKIIPFEGLCVGRNGYGINETIVVRTIKNHTAVEKIFPLYSPNFESLLVFRNDKLERIEYLIDKVDIKDKSIINSHNFATQTQYITLNDFAPISFTLSASEAKKFLVKLGTHNPDGTLSKNYCA
jgi:ribosomal protein L19